MTTPTTQREADEREGVAGLRPYEFSVCGQSLRWYLKRDVDALLAARASLTPTAPQAATTASASATEGWQEQYDASRAQAPSRSSEKLKEGEYSEGAKAMIGAVMPCGACVTNVYEAYRAGERAALARAPLPTQQVQAVDVARDAARYRVLRLHVMPGDVRLAMTQLPPKAQTPPDRIDLLCDIEISRTNTSGGSNAD